MMDDFFSKHSAKAAAVAAVLMTAPLIFGCKSAEFEAGEVTAPGVHVKDAKVKVEGKDDPKPVEKPE